MESSHQQIWAIIPVRAHAHFHLSEMLELPTRLRTKGSQAQNVFSEHNSLSFVCACLHLKYLGQVGYAYGGRVCGALSHPVKSPQEEHVSKPQVQIFRHRMLPSGPLRADYCFPRSCSNFRFLEEGRKSDRIMW